MSTPTGLFERNGHFYLRFIIPTHQRDLFGGRTRIVQSLKTNQRRQAVLAATMLRAELVAKLLSQSPTANIQTTTTDIHPQAPTRLLRDVFNRWCASKHRSKDTIHACHRALRLFEALTPNKPIDKLTRDDGDAFRAALGKLPASSKTTKDRFTWVKALMRFAHEDLGWLHANLWARLKVFSTTERPRRAWTDEEIEILLSQPIYTEGELPKAWNAGGEAAYWIPLLGLLTGARLSEIAQLKTSDISLKNNVVNIRNRDPQQRLKTGSSIRSVPIHSELLRLGFAAYISRQQAEGKDWLWSDLPRRQAKAGGFFSTWFGQNRKRIGLDPDLDFHCFRHTVRTQLVGKKHSEPLIDRLLGHSPTGSTGAKTYTHGHSLLPDLIAAINFPATAKLRRIAQYENTLLPSLANRSTKGC
jgi:integrase